MPKPILCLDFDGVIHGYQSGWRGACVIPDAPVPGTGEFLLKAIQHFRVAIFSSRSKHPLGRRAMKRYVRAILWDACLSDSPEMERAWKATQGTPAAYIPWTAYDVRDVADHIFKRGIEWPWVKPPALMTIDDRAMTFNGKLVERRIYTGSDPRVQAVEQESHATERRMNYGTASNTIEELEDRFLYGQEQRQAIPKDMQTVRRSIYRTEVPHILLRRL